LLESILLQLNKSVGGTASIKPIHDLTAHILRHTYATSLYYAGIDVKTSQRLLGYKNISVTLDIYTHLKVDNEDTAKKLERYMNA
ncbi:MAG: tyrosine-type recombinase/integrase, partial [Eubacteriales bacterium]